MTTFADLNDEQIESIFDYIDAQPVPGAGGDAAAAGGGVAVATNVEENDLGWIWYILGAVFLVIIFSVGGVKRQLEELDEDNDKQIKVGRSEEHTSELQSRPHLVCRLLLEKKKNKS